MSLFRSLLFVPGNNPRFIEKARKIKADIICFDLEDSVPEKEKETARRLIRDALGSFNSSIFVRTNSPSSKNISKDFTAIIRKGIDGIVIPKVNDTTEIKKIIKTVTTLERKQKMKPIFIIPSIESAKGVINTYQIASASKRIVAVVFGVFDLLNDMGIEYTKNPEGAKLARAKVSLDASAAGVASIDAIWQDLKDQKGLIRDCKIGRDLGYSGKSIIHPDQIDTVHKIFHPTKMQIEWAEKVCKLYSKAVQKGKGAITINGKMIDEVHYKQAKALLDIIDKIDRST